MVWFAGAVHCRLSKTHQACASGLSLSNAGCSVTLSGYAPIRLRPGLRSRLLRPADHPVSDGSQTAIYVIWRTWCEWCGFTTISASITSPTRVCRLNASYCRFCHPATGYAPVAGRLPSARPNEGADRAGNPHFAVMSWFPARHVRRTTNFAATLAVAQDRRQLRSRLPKSIYTGERHSARAAPDGGEHWRRAWRVKRRPPALHTPTWRAAENAYIRLHYYILCLPCKRPFYFARLFAVSELPIRARASVVGFLLPMTCSRRSSARSA